MNRTWPIFLGVFSLAIALVSGVARSTSTRLLQFAIQKTRVEWSEGDQDIAVVHVHITMSFTNDSKEKMILARLLPPHTDLKIEDPSGRPVPPIDQYELAHDELGEKPDPARFEIIPPEASISREFTVSFFVSKDSARTSHAAPPQGMYEISATLSTWPFWNDSNRAKHFQNLWRPDGVLIIDPVKIKKLKVNISEPQKEDARE